MIRRRSNKSIYIRGHVSVSGNVGVSFSFDVDLSGAELFLLLRILPSRYGFRGIGVQPQSL